MEKSGKRQGGCAWRLLKAAVACALLLVVALIAVFFLFDHMRLPAISFDVSPYLADDVARLVDGKGVSAEIQVERGPKGTLRIAAAGKLLDWPFSSTVNISLGFMRTQGDFSVKLLDTDFALKGDFDVRSAKRWSVYAYVPEMRFSSDDAVLGRIIPRLGLSSVSNITCSGTFSFAADARSTDALPVPEWKAKGSIKNADVSLVADECPVRARNLRLRFGASGIADRTDIDPMFPRIDSVNVGGVAFTNVFANIRATEKAYLVTEARAGCAGGTLTLYSLFLDAERLNAGATAYIEDVDAGEALAFVPSLRGNATGRLHGKMTFFLRGGKTLRVRDVFLFSNPGETGTLKIADGKPLIDNLAIGGVPDEMCQNLSLALANLNYSVLRLRLGKDSATGVSALSLKISGNASHETTTVPVNLDITFRGDIDQLIDTGMKITR